MPINWLNIARELQSIAQSGLTFGENKYDIERYEQIRELSIKIIAEQTQIPTEKVRDLFVQEKGYLTPKVDVRGVVFRDDKILMVRESIDGKWTLPGGWADVNLSPFENTAKEVYEEAGIKTTPVRLLAIFDKMKHTHPPDLWHVYKLFILCEDEGGKIKPGLETLEVAWVDRDEIPEDLSLPRITREQIATMFEFLDDPGKDTMCD